MNDIALCQLSNNAYSEKIVSVGDNVTKIVDIGTDTECFIISNHREQTIVFRGTEITSIKDLKTDLKFKSKNGFHEGFYEAFLSIKSELFSNIDLNKKTYITGHSLGGALAIITTIHLPIQNKYCVTFGSPRVVTNEITKQLKDVEKKIFRYENVGDPVPYLPPYMMGYRHIGTLLKGGSHFDLIFTSLENQLNAHQIDNYLKDFYLWFLKQSVKLK